LNEEEQFDDEKAQKNLNNEEQAGIEKKIWKM